MFEKDLKQGKLAEQEVLQLISKTNKSSVNCTSRITDIDLDKKGIDCFISTSSDEVYSADVKTYTFGINVAESKGWFRDGQVLCLEIVGGPESACFSNSLKKTDLVLYYWSGMYPSRIGLDQFENYLKKGYTSHVLFEYSFAHFLVQHNDFISKEFTGAKVLRNNFSSGSFLNITVQSLLNIRRSWIRAGGASNAFVDQFNEEHFDLYGLKY